MTPDFFSFPWRTDDGKVVHTQVMTDASGNYTFDNLAAGKYMVMEKQPAGFRDGTDTAGSAGGTLRGRDLMAQIQLTACTTATGYNFGERPVAPRPSPDCNVPEKGNNGVGNGLDPQPPGNPPINDGPGTSPGNPGNRGGF